MLTRFRTLASLYRQLGLRWLTFRFAYAFRLRTGIIRLQTPICKWTDRPLETWLKKNIPSQPESYANWRKQNSPQFFHVGAGSPRPEFRDPAISEANRILNGEIKYFAHEFQKTGFPPDWHKDPVSGIKLDSSKHWSQISDDNVAARRSWFLPKRSPTNSRGLLRREEQVPASQRHFQTEVDIKFIWEPNRFAFIYTLVRAYAAAKDEKYAEAFWNLISDWAEHNPPNTGANWKDGQEIALRLMAWTFGFYAFINSPSTTQLQIAQFTAYVAAQAERIYKNIDYAISTRSNHTISEAFGLWMVGLLFPELKDSEKYFSTGRELLEQEAVKQIFSDGSYSMYSLNYHRFVLHIYLYAMRLGDINHFPLSTQLQKSIANSIQYLSKLIDPQTGQMPVYGSNDGALVLPLNNCDFTDYRPLLQLGSVITKGERMFESGAWDEDVFWLCSTVGSMKKEEIGKKLGDIRVLRGDSFPKGGMYILRNTNSKAVIRCTDFQERPSHADQLHVDLWLNGINIASDAGTYLYSGKGIWRNGLAHTSAHNTVIVDSRDQMKMISRFVWTDWSKGKVLQQTDRLWQGEHNGYKPVTHKRTVMALDGDRWLVVDHLDANEPHHYSLHWLLNDAPFEENKNSIHLKYESSMCKFQTGVLSGKQELSIVRADPNSMRGWRSKYYGHKEPAISVMLETDQSHTVFWTFFGSGEDQVELRGEVLQVNSLEINLKTVDGGR
ncbi:MAG: alginate lyase family protein [Chloroflexi bacterium]|nr:alginate lyase family protein [Chloroflexota bacterium]